MEKDTVFINVRLNKKDTVAVVADCNIVDFNSYFDDSSSGNSIQDRYSQSASSTSNGKNDARSIEQASIQSIKSICSKIADVGLENDPDGTENARADISKITHSYSDDEQRVNNFWWDYRDTLKRESELEAQLLLKESKIAKVFFI